MPDLYLAHHGIKGQKWGVRRWQNDDGSLTDAGRKHYGYGDGRRNSSIEVVSKSRKKSSGYSDENAKEEKKKFKLTYKQKRNIAIGVGVAATCLAAYGFYRYMNPIDNNKIDLSDNPNFDKASGFLKKVSESSSIEDAAAVNPRSDMTNCAKCSAAYELRRRGYDVMAGKHADKDSFVQRRSGIYEYFDYNYINGSQIKPRVQAYGKTELKELDNFAKKVGLNTDNGKPLEINKNLASESASFDFRHIRGETSKVRDSFRKTCPEFYNRLKRRTAYDIQDMCSDLGPNARGSIAIPYTIDGHMISFENDSNGKTTFIDSQISNKKSKSSSFGSFVEYLKESGAYKDYNPFYETVVYRTDDAEPNFEFLKENRVIENNIPDKLIDKVATGGRYASAMLAEVGFVSAATYQEKINKKKKEQKKERK